MSDISNLERLLNSDAALEQARISQSSALRTQQLLQQPLSNFNPGSLRDPAGQQALERLQASIRVQQYLESGTLQHAPAPPPPIGNTSTAGSAASAGSSALNAATDVIGGPTTAPRVNAPAQINIPTSGFGSLLRAYDVYQMIQQGAVAIGNIATGVGNIGSILAGNPEDVQPLTPYFADPTEDFLRRLNQGQRNLFGRDANQINPTQPAGNPPTPDRGGGGVGSYFGLNDGLACAIFGISCPTDTEGVPNLGSPGLEPPFYGGQSPVPYYVSFQTSTIDHNGYENIYPPEFRQVLGPVRGIAKRQAFPPEGERTEFYLLHAPMGNNPTGETFLGSYLTSAFQSVSTVITAISRVDGQPDTGGNPAPSPDAESRPATVPALGNRQVFPPPGAPTPQLGTVPNPSTTLTPTTPTAPPGTGTPPVVPPDADQDSPLSPFNPNLPFIPAFTPVRPPSGSNNFNPSGTLQPNSNPPRTTTTIENPTLTCRYDNRNISGKVDQANTTLQFVELYMQQQIMSKLNTIDNKLGKQIPNGGISSYLDTMFSFAKKTWNFLQIDRILNLLTWIGVLHNAFMLSNTLVQSLFSMVEIALKAFGIEDADGGEINVRAAVGKFAEDFFNDLLGEATVDEIQAKWAKWNRIYQAAANIIYSVQSMVYSLAEILENISNYVGRIGNALKKSGTILQNSFGWMNTNIQFTDNRFFRFLQRAQDGVEIIDQTFSEVVSIQESATEFAKQREEFSKAFGEEEGKIAGPEEKAAADQKTTIKITPTDEIKAEVD